VKIQRPGIRERVVRDLSRARVLARVLEAGRVSAVVPPREVVEELTSWMLEELDFAHELANVTRLYELAANSAVERIPRPYPELSTALVLTTDYVPGIPFSELLLSLRSGTPQERGRIAASGVDVDRLAENLIRATLTQMFRYRFFHADLHPGNLLALPDDTVGFVDFGLCDELDETVGERQTRYLEAVYARDVDRMFAALVEILVPAEETDIAAFRRDFSAETRTYLGRIGSSSEHATEGARSPIADWMVAVMRVARRHGMRLPSRVLSMYRALLTAESVAHQLGARADLRTVGRDFFRALRLDELAQGFDPNDVQAAALTWLSLVRDGPGQLQQLLSELSSGRYALTVNMTESPRTARARDRRARLVSTAVLAATVSTLVVAAAVADVSRGWTWVLLGVLAVVYAAIGWQWRRL
jgi:ubiquinone biosynthesis protein